MNSYSGQRTALCVMAKLPRAGAVNTRMQPEFSPEEAARLQYVFLWDLLGRSLDVRDKWLAIADEESDQGQVHTQLFETWPELYRRAVRYHWQFMEQPGDGLGTRMASCAEMILHEEGITGVAILGTDAPGMPMSLLSRLTGGTGEADAMIVPSPDGGYVGITVTVASLSLLQGQIPWGTPLVFTRTVELADAGELSLEVLESWPDIDTVADLRRELVECIYERREVYRRHAPETWKFAHKMLDRNADT